MFQPSICTDVDEPLLQDNDDRFILSSSNVKYPKIWELYKKHVASFWTVDETDLYQDKSDWENLTNNERFYIKRVLAFFAGSDGIVIENLARRFISEVQIPEARAFYGFQMAMENIHSETYSLLIETYVTDKNEQQELFGAIRTMETVKRKADWALKWIDSSSSFATRLIAFIVVEGIFFSGSFCALFWLKKRNLLQGLTFTNELISRDEGLHCDMGIHLYSLLKKKLPQESVHRIFTEAVEIEKEFVSKSLPVDLIGMNSKLMCKYIEYVADRFLYTLGYDKKFHSKNPFDFMESISLQGKTNFFERRVGEYQKSGVMNSLNKKAKMVDAFTLDEDF